MEGRHVIKNRAPLAARSRPLRLPLSCGQQRLWFIDRLKGGSPEYNIPRALHLRGELDRTALERALHTIVERHEILRTRLLERDGEPEQVIEPSLRIEVPLDDLSALGAAAREQRVAEVLCREGSRTLDLTRGPLLRLMLLKLGDREHILMWIMHHVVSDGWSQGIFNRELMILYGAYRNGRENPLPPLEVQYADFTLWQREWLEGEMPEDELAYWKTQLAGIPELELPLDRPRPAMQTFDAGACRVTLSAGQVTDLKRLSQANRATLYMTLLSAFGALLARYSGQNDIVVGSPVAGRAELPLEEMIGFFVNSLAMRIRLKEEMSFRELLGQVRQTALEAYRRQEVPFERLVEELSPPRRLNATPVFQVLFALQNTPPERPDLDGLETEPLRRDRYMVRTDLEVHAAERAGCIELHWWYNRDLFDGWRMEQMARHYVRVLESMIADIDGAIGAADLLSDAERRQILEEWNDTAVDFSEVT